MPRFLVLSSTLALAACSGKVGDGGAGAASGKRSTVTPEPTNQRAAPAQDSPMNDAGGSVQSASDAQAPIEPPPPPPPVPETHADGIKNVGESDVDCGGVLADASGQAARCGVAKTCAAHADCTSDGCNADTWTCAAAKSCAQTRGGLTCGKGESADPSRVHESCCETVTLPRAASEGGAFTIDKYAITTGRYRQFMERTGGNVEAALRANGRYAEWAAKWGAWASRLPRNMVQAEELVDTYRHDWEWEHPSHRLPPNDPAYREYAFSANGCWVGNGSGGGGHTYYLPSDGAGTYGKDVLDEKMMNCVHPFMVDAFCMWEGGEMWDETMMHYAWNGAGRDSRRYPWGNTPVPIDHEDGAPADPFHVSAEYIVHGWNYPHPTWEMPYAPGYRDGGGPFALSPPGRRPMGNARAAGVGYSAANPLAGVADLAGGVYQPVWSKTRRQMGWSSGGSFEVHKTFIYGEADFDNNWIVPHRRYYAVGGRCAR